jgi:hypothetical protein
LLPIALRSVQGRRDYFLPISVVGHDVEDLPSSSWSPATELMDEGGAGGAILECRYSVVVGRTGELGALLGEAPDVFMQALAQLLLAVP